MEAEQFLAVLRHGLRDPLGHRDVRVCLLECTVAEPNAGEHDRELGIGRRDPRREGIQQRAKRGQTAIEDQADAAVKKQPRGAAPVARHLRVADRLDRVALLLEPVGGRPMQLTHDLRKHPPQLQPQQVGKQVVVAEPGATRIDRGHKRA